MHHQSTFNELKAITGLDVLLLCHGVVLKVLNAEDVKGFIQLRFCSLTRGHEMSQKNIVILKKNTKKC